MSDIPDFQKVFPPTTDEDWNSRLQKELRGAPFENLQTVTREGITLSPFYRADAPDPNGIPGLLSRIDNRWDFRTTIEVEDPDEAMDIAEDSHARGVECVEFAVDSGALMAQLDLINLENPEYRHEIRLRDFPSYAIPILRTSKLETIRLDLLGALAKRGDYATNEEIDWERMRNHLNSYPRGIVIDGTLWCNAGLPAHWQLGLCLSMQHDYLARLGELGFDSRQVVEALCFRLATGPDFFTEIAKYRALRVLADLLLQPWLESERPSIPIQAVNAYWNQVRPDANTNLLRMSTATLAAVIGGADAVHVLPHDEAFNSPNRESRRIADNMQLLLRHESHLDVVSDAAAGSWYLEELTDQLAARAWEVFQTIEAQGGFEKALFSGLISARCEKAAEDLKQRIAEEEEILVGLNRFPNAKDKTPEAREIIRAGAAAEPSFNPIRTFRAEPELLKRKSEKVS